MESGKRDGIKNRKRRLIRRRWRRRRKAASVILLGVLIIGLAIFLGHKCLELMGKTVMTSQKGKNIVAEEKKYVEVKLSMVGDILTHTQVMESGRRSDGSYHYNHLFRSVKKQMESSDIAIANQEVILGGTELGLSSYPDFNAPQEIGDALAASGFNTILHATNHTMDKGEEAVNNTLEFWKEKHPEVSVLGIHETQEEQDEIHIFEKDGFKIAILNYTYGLNGIKLPKNRPYLVDLMDKEKMDEDLKKAEKLADFTVVCPHWGTEYQFEETEEQKEWTQFFLERGVDLVLGAHPHVIEPVKWVEDGENKMLVYYSLGNFVSRQDKWYTMLGAMANVTIRKDSKGKVSITDYGVEPLVTHIGTTEEDYTTYYLKDYTEELAKKNKIRNQYSEFSIKKLEELSKDVFGDLYKSGTQAEGNT